ncbi:MAG: PIN domain-containing protein [Gammaproteobacteria bacterium]
MKYLLDSVILIDHFNNISKATKWLNANIKNSYISVITRAEILVGFDSDELLIAKSFLDSFKTLPITQSEADIAAELRRQQKWKLPDALQAAVAINHKLLLVTRNTKDFSPKAHTFIAIPYTL